MDGFEISAPAAFVVVRAQLKVVGQGSRREADMFACKNKTQKSFKKKKSWVLASESSDAI